MSNLSVLGENFKEFKNPYARNTKNRYPKDIIRMIRYIFSVKVIAIVNIAKIKFYSFKV